MGLHCWSERKYLVFDPTVSLHYEVFSVPEVSDYIPPGHVCKDTLPSTMEWPPTTYVMHVSSSSTGVWEERSFVREGNAVGTVADFKRDSVYKQPFRTAAYWHGALYINCDDSCVLRYFYELTLWTPSTYSNLLLMPGSFSVLQNKGVKQNVSSNKISKRKDEILYTSFR
jgi:hypothetical protein